MVDLLSRFVTSYFENKKYVDIAVGCEWKVG